MLATWFYLGKLRPAPGTWGTLGAIPLILGLSLLPPNAYLAGAFGFTILAMFVAHFYGRSREGHDRQEIVIDEVAGFLITMAWLPLTWQTWILGFMIFRVLDIYKPPPIRQIDQKVRGGVGVVADDVVAGIIANLILQILFVQTAWLGYQLPS